MSKDRTVFRRVPPQTNRPEGKTLPHGQTTRRPAARPTCHHFRGPPDPLKGLPYSRIPPQGAAGEAPASLRAVASDVPAKETLYGDLERAGIQGGTRTGSCPTNAAGERVDFHALRTTFATRLANAGIAPQLLKRLMRHANIATTDVHYVGLRTSDLGAHLGRVADLSVELAATGTDGARSAPWTTSHKTSHKPGRQGRISADVGGLPSRKHGPVAQRPRAIDS
ncbi:MAG: site-specific integrase [Phycisphaerales bacterium]|nr:site-specific integrase [Phycisphaerales bacterium]